MMKTFAAVILCIGALASIPEPVQSVSIYLPDCRSHFRILYPQYFTHCNCEYFSYWTEWEQVPGSIHPVLTAQCPSGQAYHETRTQEAIGEGCDLRIERQTVCMPDLTDRLILAFGLGNSGINTSVIQSQRQLSSMTEPTLPTYRYVTAPPPSPIPLNIRGRRRAKGPFCGSKAICHDYLEPRGKRSSPAESLQQTSHHVPSPTETEEAPLPFEWKQHHHRFRRQQQCSRNDVQHVLFLLDTSGSISSDSFDKMKDAVAKLIFHFCRQVQVAVMTFNHNFNIEFCFDCYGNTCTDRRDAHDAIRGITQRYGLYGLTHTGGATACACNVLLKKECGLPPTARCISVVYITDGHSNDPNRRVCTEIMCLHNRAAVETYAIGIDDDINQEELRCIGKATDINSIIHFDNFTHFKASVNEIEERFFTRPSEYQCPNAVDDSGGLPCIF